MKYLAVLLVCAVGFAAAGNRKILEIVMSVGCDEKPLAFDVTCAV
jgi:hypothetical protein